MNKSLDARINADPEKLPIGMILTDAFPAGAEVTVTRSTAFEPDEAIKLVVFPAKDGNENGCYITPFDAGRLGILLDTPIRGDAPIDEVLVTYEEKAKDASPKPNGGGIVSEDRPICLTAPDFLAAIQAAETASDALVVALNQLTALGYKNGADALRERFTL